MTGRSRLWWFRQSWPWKVADVLNRLGRCWAGQVKPDAARCLPGGAP